MDYQKLEELDSDDVEKVRISRSNVSIYTTDDVIRLHGLLDNRNDYRYLSLNGAQIHTTLSGYDPSLEVTTVEEFDYHRLEYEGDVEEEQLTVKGRGEFRQ